MSVLKKYNEGTSQWEAVVVGKQGNSGVVAVTAPITNSGTSTSAVLGFNANFFGQSAGKNYTINGGFDIWQRGTSFSHVGSTVIYNADRWGTYRSGFAAGLTTSRQSSGLTGFQYSARVQRDSGNTSTAGVFFVNALETVSSIPLAGQSVTLSFYAKAGANFSGGTLSSNVISGTGTDQTAWAGFTGYTNITSAASTLTSSFQRFTFTGTVPANATQLATLFSYTPSGTAGANDWFEITGVQLEYGTVATPFSRAGGTIQGELAACQRYYVRFTAPNVYSVLMPSGYIQSTTLGVLEVPLPVTMRVTPYTTDYANIEVLDALVSAYIPSSIAMAGSCSNSIASINPTISGGTAGRFARLRASNSTAGYIGFSAELQ